jgi:hypothetical protein
MRIITKSLPVVVLLLACGFSSGQLVKTKVSDGITVSLPAELLPMAPEDIALRFPSVRAPLGAYSDQDRLVDFNVNISATKWPDGDVEIAQKFFKASLRNLYDRVDFITGGIQVLKKKKFIFFEFESRINGDRRKQGSQEPILKYTYIQYLVQPKRTLVFTFTCPKDQRELWQEKAGEMMRSVRVR